MPLRGKVKWFDVQRGYGFVKIDNETRELFVHVSSCRMSNLLPGQRVEFIEGTSARTGLPEAQNIEVIELDD